MKMDLGAGMLLVFFALGLLLFLVIFFVVFLGFFRVWLRGFLSGAPVPLPQILGMKLRGNPAPLIVDAYIQLKHKEKWVSIAELERIYMAARNRVHSSEDLVRIMEKELKGTSY